MDFSGFWKSRNLYRKESIVLFYQEILLKRQEIGHYIVFQNHSGQLYILVLAIILIIMRNILFILSIIILQSCMKGEAVDLVIFNAKIHSLDEGNHYQAMAIKDGKIVELGPDRQILNKYRYTKSVDAAGKEIYPGFIDAHGHLFSYAELKLVQIY